MGNAVEKIYKSGEIVRFRGKNKTKESVKLKLDGTPKITISGGKKGVPHEVYGFRKKEDIDKMISYFINKKENAATDIKRKQAGRNLLVFIFGINTSIRPGDLLQLKWSDIFDSNGDYWDYSRTQEGKTKKYKNLSFNAGIRNAIDKYVDEFDPDINSDKFLFKSNKTGALKSRRLNEIISEAAKECGIQYRVGSYSLRKTFGYWFIKNNNNDMTALAKLQELYNHDSPATTLRYIGLNDEETKKYYESSVLGLY